MNELRGRCVDNKMDCAFYIENNLSEYIHIYCTTCLNKIQDGSIFKITVNCIYFLYKNFGREKQAMNRHKNHSNTKCNIEIHIIHIAQSFHRGSI